MKKKIYLVISLVICFMLLMSFTACKEDEPTPPVDKILRLVVPSNWELEVGDSRTVDYTFDASITARTLTWTVDNTSIATVDEWGRVTAVSLGSAVITATNPAGITDSTTLTVVPCSTASTVSLSVVNYSGSAVSLGDNLQKVVTRYENGDENIPANIRSISDYSSYQSATTADGAIWTVTEYGVLRTYAAATNERDTEQRFMGNRYFYSSDTSGGNVLGIAADGANGIWTFMTQGVTHISMVEISGIDKALQMNAITDEYVMRRGMVSEAVYTDGEWIPQESDNDGLWTSMYAAGELMRYSVLKNSGTATADEIAAARESAMISTEAVLLLSNLCMRTGTTEAYVRYQPNARYDEANGRYLSETALEAGGDYSLNIPECSPADAFTYAYELYLEDGSTAYFLTDDYLDPYSAESWSDPRDGEGEYAKRTRNLEGYIVRTYSLREENNSVDGYIHWSFNDDGTAIGVSTKGESSLGYYLNGENLRGVTVDASGEVPARLWNDMIGEGYSVEDIVYKGDTSSDELIGHLFLYKLAYDILGSEDAELKSIIANTMDRLAQHVSDNNYMMVDGSGQPDTWAKFNREFFYNSSQLGGAPMTASVVLCLFKLAHYVTGYQKWADEYEMAALDPAYEYAKLTTQYHEQCYMLMMLTLDDVSPLIRNSLNNQADLSYGSATSEMLIRLFLNYSDEEMAMLAFYLLFQMEDDEQLLNLYRQAIDDWWISIKYSENPLWYYIYQLAYPDRTITDAYGNNILETAAWSLSRHPMDLIRYSASNTARDDIAEFGLSSLGFGDISLSYDCSNGKIDTSNFTTVFNVLLSGDAPEWAVAAYDERAFHKYNGSTYNLDGYNVNVMEGGTTYTLPFWMGMYHGMLSSD
jgi:hypothetical protein